MTPLRRGPALHCNDVTLRESAILDVIESSRQKNSVLQESRLGKDGSRVSVGESNEDMESGVNTKTEESIRRLLPTKEKLPKGQIQQSVASVTGKRRDLQARAVDSSLSSFVEQWSGRNSGPMDLVQKYLVHVATNVEDVFASDASGTVALTSCILSCKYFPISFWRQVFSFYIL